MVGRRLFAWRWWFALLGLCCAPQSLSAAELKADLTTLLDIGWQTSVRSYQEAERQYVRLAEVYPAEVRLPYAMALVAIKHRRYSTALTRIDEMLALNPELWLGQRARLWLLVVLQQNEAALEQAATLCEHMAADKKLDELQRSPRIHWIGRIVAYIAAPTGANLQGELIRRYEQRILAALTPALTIIFDEGRDSLLTDFSERTFAQQQTKAQEKQDQVQEQAERKVELKSEKEQTVDAAGDIESQANALREQLDSNLSEFDQAISERQSQLAQIQSQAAVILATMDQLAANMNAIQLQLDATPPSNVLETNRLLAILRAWDFDYARQSALYRPLAVQGQTLQNQIANLAAQRQQTIAQFEAQMKKLGRTLTNLQRRALRIESDEKKLDKEPSGVTAKVRAQNLVLSALTTYEPFPVEQEKQTILRSLK